MAICVFEPFITAAAGLGLPQFSPLFYRLPLLPYAVTSAQLPPPRRHPPDNGWDIVDEVGDGACLLRTIARRVFGNPELHPQVRSEIVSHIAQNSQPYIMHISNGFGNEPIHILGNAPRTYHNLQDCLQIMLHPNTYAGYIEIAAAIQLYNIAINITFSESSLPSFPIHPSHLHRLTFLDIFAESAWLVHPWHLRGRTVQLSCGTVQLFFGFLLGLIVLYFCSFCQLFLDLSAASCKFVFSANTIFNFFAIFSSYHFPLICRLCILVAERSSFSFSLIHTMVFVLYLTKFHQLHTAQQPIAAL